MGSAPATRVDPQDCAVCAMSFAARFGDPKKVLKLASTGPNSGLPLATLRFAGTITGTCPGGQLGSRPTRCTGVFLRLGTVGGGGNRGGGVAVGCRSMHGTASELALGASAVAAVIPANPASATAATGIRRCASARDEAAMALP